MLLQMIYSVITQEYRLFENLVVQQFVIKLWQKLQKKCTLIRRTNDSDCQKIVTNVHNY